MTAYIELGAERLLTQLIHFRVEGFLYYHRPRYGIRTQYVVSSYIKAAAWLSLSCEKVDFTDLVAISVGP
jgi:hypothetical protein